MEEAKGYEGSGNRAMTENLRVLAELRAQMQDLERRAASGEIVDSEVRTLKAKMDMLKEDRGRIESAGMV